MRQERFLGDSVKALGFCFSSHTKDVVLVELPQCSAAAEAEVPVNAFVGQAKGHWSCRSPPCF